MPPWAFDEKGTQALTHLAQSNVLPATQPVTITATMAERAGYRSAPITAAISVGA